MADPRTVVAGPPRVAGLELDIDGHGTTQTYGSRDLDVARAMVLEYLATAAHPHQPMP
ncbi:hypothetical protein GS884_08735 [Rhodococcus hoagii]|nr:hypothetical protein [Prescottella equi]